MSGEKKFWTEFLKLYRELPTLWRIKSDEYRSRKKKAEAYEILIDKLKEKYPDADREMVVKKINAFRTTYRKELKKVQNSVMMGAGIEDVHKPTLWYYRILSFLEDQDDWELSTYKMEDETQEEEALEASNFKASSFQAPSFKMSPNKNKKKHKPVDSDELLQLAAKRLKQSDVSDYSQTLGKTWANEFNLLTPEQQMFAKKAIDDILFEGRLGTLYRNSITINQPPESDVEY